MTYYLAVDIGASSGRHILGYIDNGKIKLEEIYRFENGIEEKDGTLTWNIDKLLAEVKNGLRECKKIGKIPVTVAIDTWGVDYVLLDENEKEILPCVAYRDSRTTNIPYAPEFPLTPEELFKRTGIQMQYFNSIYQLYCDKKSGKLAKAKHFLMMPAYLSYKLTGKIANEYTLASTTALVNAEDKTWDKEIISALGIDEKLFCKLCNPCDIIGNLSKEIQAEVGFDTKVIFAPSHDTASAVAACPIDDRSVYISSGTWSLIGTENAYPILSEEALNADFTNEGGIEYRFRFLENIMGMWLLQNIRKNLDKKFTYDEMMKMAENSAYDKTFDPNDSSLVAPENMIEAVNNLLGDKDLPLGDTIKSVYLSLAKSYDRAVKQIEIISNKKVENIMIVGGGSKDTYLNRLTAEITGKTVITGLSEATALGNIISQVMADKKINITEARAIIRNSFDIREN